MGEPPHTLPMTFTDAELAFLRHVRFGELPPRVLPEEYVELAETDPPRVKPEEVQEIDRATWNAG